MGSDSGFLTGILASWRNSKAVANIRGSELLDVGCGDGELLEKIRQKKITLNYTGMDILPEKNRPDFTFVAGSIETKVPELADKKFDCITMIAVIEHLKDYDSAVKNAAGLLKKGGRIIITTPTPPGDRAHKFLSRVGGVSGFAAEDHQHIFTLSELRALLEKNDFKVALARHFQFGFNQIIVGEKN